MDFFDTSGMHAAAIISAVQCVAPALVVTPSGKVDRLGTWFGRVEETLSTLRR